MRRRGGRVSGQGSDPYRLSGGYEPQVVQGVVTQRDAWAAGNDLNFNDARVTNVYNIINVFILDGSPDAVELARRLAAGLPGNSAMIHQAPGWTQAPQWNAEALASPSVMPALPQTQGPGVPDGLWASVPEAESSQVMADADDLAEARKVVTDAADTAERILSLARQTLDQAVSDGRLPIPAQHITLTVADETIYETLNRIVQIEKRALAELASLATSRMTCAQEAANQINYKTDEAANSVLQMAHSPSAS